MGLRVMKVDASLLASMFIQSDDASKNERTWIIEQGLPEDAKIINVGKDPASSIIWLYVSSKEFGPVSTAVPLPEVMVKVATHAKVGEVQVSLKRKK